MPHKWPPWAACAFAVGWISACGVDAPFTHPKPAAPAAPDYMPQALSPVTPLLEMMSALPQGEIGRAHV